MIDEETLANITNREEVEEEEIAYNYPNQLGLRLFVKTDSYFTQSVFTEDEKADWPVYPFFNVSLAPERNFNCYSGRGVYETPGFQKIQWKLEGGGEEAVRGRDNIVEISDNVATRGAVTLDVECDSISRSGSGGIGV